MEITYFGHSSFRLKGKNAVVITDPYNSEKLGLKFPKHAEADIVTVSHDHVDHNEISAVEKGSFIIHGPGEYEVKGVGIVGISTYHDDKKGEERGSNTMYRFEIDGVSVVHLGDLGHALSTAQVDELDGVNVLLVPVGGVYSLDPSQAVAVVNEIEPSIVIPMHYGRPELNQEIYGAMSPLAAFLKEIGKEDAQPQPKLSLTKDKLPPEMQVVVLE